MAAGLESGYLIGGQAEDAIWVRATGKFIEALSGEVEVFLGSAEFDRVLRLTPAHPIFKIPEIKRIVYYLDDAAGRIPNPPAELYTNGVVKQAFGKQLVFRAQRNETFHRPSPSLRRDGSHRSLRDTGSPLWSTEG